MDDKEWEEFERMQEDRKWEEDHNLIVGVGVSSFYYLRELLEKAGRVGEMETMWERFVNYHYNMHHRGKEVRNELN